MFMKRIFTLVIAMFLLCACSSQLPPVEPSPSPTAKEDSVRALALERFEYSAHSCRGWFVTYLDYYSNGNNTEIPRMRAVASLGAMAQLLRVLGEEANLGVLDFLIETFTMAPTYYEPQLAEIVEIMELIGNDHSDENAYMRLDSILEYFKG
jgi:hypothetical protein